MGLYIRWRELGEMLRKGYLSIRFKFFALFIVISLVTLFTGIITDSVYAEEPSFGQGNDTNLGVIRGAVIGSNGKGLEGAEIYLWNSEDMRQMVTDSTGTFRFNDLPFGRYYIMIWNTSAAQGELVFAGVNDIDLSIDNKDITLKPIDITQDFDVSFLGQGPFDLNDIIKTPIGIIWTNPVGKGIENYFLGFTSSKSFMGADFIWSRRVDKGTLNVSFDGKSGHRDIDGRYIGDGSLIKPGAYYLFVVYTTDDGLVGGLRVPVVLVDRKGPVINHEPIARTVALKPLNIQAEITDIPGISTATLFYRTLGTTEYFTVEMKVDSNGVYSATIPAVAVPEEGIEYYIRAADLSGNVTTWPDIQKGEPNKVMVVKGNAISGQLWDIDSGKGLFNARVVAINEDGERVGETFSDAEGSYLLKNLPAGTLRISAFKEGYRATDKSSATIELKEGDWHIDLHFAISLDGTLKGRLFYNGTALAGRIVTIYSVDGSLNTKVEIDGNGIFNINPLPAGTYVLAYERPENGNVYELQTWHSGGRFSSRIILNADRWVYDLGDIDIGYRGILKPLNDTKVNLRDLDKEGPLFIEWSEHTGAKGYWVELFKDGLTIEPRFFAYTTGTNFWLFPNQITPGEYGLRIGIQGQGWFGESDSIRISFFQPEVGKVAGRLVDAHTGEGLPNARLFINGVEVLRSGVDGSFITDELQVGTYNLTALKEGYAPLAEPVTVSVVGNEIVGGVVMELPLNGSISGYVTLNGKGGENIELLLIDSKGGQKHVYTDGNGQFSFTGLVSDAYVLRLSPKDIHGSGLEIWEKSITLSSTCYSMNLGGIELGYPGILNLRDGEEVLIDEWNTPGDPINFRLSVYPGVSAYNIFVKDLLRNQAGYLFPDSIDNIGAPIKGEDLVAGIYEVSIHGKLVGGQIRSKPIKLTLISSSAIEILSPIDGAVFKEPPIILEGQLKDSRITKVKVNDELFSIDDDLFKVAIDAQEGKNLIYLTGLDNEGRVLARTTSAFNYAPLSKVSGHVLDAFARPIKGALVVVKGIHTIQEATTDDNGFFEVEGIGLGSVKVQAAPPTKGRDLMDLAFATGETTVKAPHFKLDLVLKKVFDFVVPSYGQRFDINDLLNEPIPFEWEMLRDIRIADIEVRLTPAEDGDMEPVWVQSNVKGTSLTFDGKLSKASVTSIIEAGEYLLHLSFKDFQGGGGTISTPLTLEDKVPPRLEHTHISNAIVASPLKILAKVEDVSEELEAKLFYKTKGQSAFKTLVMTEEKDNIYSATIVGSEMTFDGIEYKIYASDASGNFAFLPRGGEDVYSVQVTTGMEINGRVIDPRTRRGVPDAKVFVDGQVVTTTDENGLYKVRNMTQGHKVISVERDGYLQNFNSSTRVTLAPRSVIQGVDLELVFDGNIKGKIVANLVPQGGKKIQITGPGYPKGSILTTNADGSFELRKVPAGLYTFQYNGADASEIMNWQVTMELDEANPNIDIGVIEVKYEGIVDLTNGQIFVVEDLIKDPLDIRWQEYPEAEGYVVTLLNLGTDETLPLAQELIVDNNFKAYSWERGLGSYLVSLDVHLPYGGIVKTRNTPLIVLASKDIIKLNIPYEGYKVYKKEVLLEGGITDPSVVEVLVDRTTVPIDRDGRFSISVELIEGENTIFIQAKDSIGSPIGMRTVTLFRETQAPTTVISNAVSITGRLLKDGRPVAGRTVLAVRIDESSNADITDILWSSTTNLDGIYSFSQLPPGSFSILYINLQLPDDEFYLVHTSVNAYKDGTILSVADMEIANKVTLLNPSSPRYFRINEVTSKGLAFSWEIARDVSNINGQFIGLLEMDGGQQNEVWGQSGGEDFNQTIFYGELDDGSLIQLKDYYVQIGFIRKDGMLYAALYKVTFIN